MSLKIIVMGPEKAGKTFVTNAIADHTTDSSLPYDPTIGVRILETEVNLSAVYGREANVEVELWDCSGSSKYQSCWPMLQHNAQGVIFIYDPAVSHHKVQLELFYDYFAVQGGIPNSNCLLLGNERLSEGCFDLPDRFEGVTHKRINAKEDTGEMKAEFQHFVQHLKITT